MLRTITGKKLQHGTDRVLTLQRGRGLVTQHHRKRWFQVFFECGHATEVPFGRRPKIGKRATCPTCTEGQRGDV